MRLCGIIPDLTHYYGELGATIRAPRRGKAVREGVGGEGGRTRERSAVGLACVPRAIRIALDRFEARCLLIHA